MADYKTVSGYAVIPLLATVLVLLGLNAQPDPTHYCESIQKQSYCYNLSEGLGTRCFLTPDKTKNYKNCPEGWKLKPSIPIPEIPKQEIAVEPSNIKVIVVAYVDYGDKTGIHKLLCTEPGPNQVCYEKPDLNLPKPFNSQ